MRGSKGREGNGVKGKEESCVPGKEVRKDPMGKRVIKETDAEQMVERGEEWKRLTRPLTELEYESYSSQGK